MKYDKSSLEAIKGGKLVTVELEADGNGGFKGMLTTLEPLATNYVRRDESKNGQQSVTDIIIINNLKSSGSLNDKKYMS